MTLVTTLQDLLTLLGLALVNAYGFSKLRQSPIIGYLVTGMIIGPYGFHLVQGVHEVEMMAEIGVILLLFTIGLEFSISRILRLKGLMLRSGSAQVILTGALVYSTGRIFGLVNATSLALAMAFALSSTAIVLKLLLEQGQIDSAHGRIALAILLYQDLAVVFFLVTLPLLGGQSGSFSWLAIAKAGGLMAGLFAFSHYLLRPLLQGILRTRAPELFRLTILALVLGTAWVTGQAGLSLALGAFLAGLALAESDYAHQALSDMLPFRDTFLAIFFISMGMLVNVRALADDWTFVLLLFLAVSLLKIGTGTLAASLSSYPLRTALLCGLMLFQVGEFSFVLLKEALTLEVMDERIYQLALSVIALSMMATPPLIGRAQALAASVAGWFRQPMRPVENDLTEHTGNLSGHVIIAGYGVSGRNVARALREAGLAYIHIEMNGEVVRRARAKGEFIIYGDATSATVLEGVGIERARALVLAINDPAALGRAIQTARELNPELYILARTRFVLELEHLCSLGADEVIPDEFEASLQLAACLLRRFAIPEGQTLKLLATLRHEHYGRLRQSSEPRTNLSGYLSVLDQGRIEFQAIPGDSPCLGRTLAELQFRNRTGVMIVGLIRQEKVLYGPSADLRLEPGDTLMLLGAPEDMSRAQEILHGRIG